MTILFGAKSTVTKWTNEATAKTASLALGSESNRIVIGVVSIGETLDSTPTFNGVAMTLAKEQLYASSGYARIYYMLDASLPGAGSYDFSVDPSSATYGCMAVYYIYNAAQQAPEATAGGTGSSATPSTNITTVTNNAFIADCLNTVGGVSGTKGANTEEHFDDYSVSRGFVCGSKSVGAAAVTAFAWTLSSASNYAHALAAFESASMLDDANTKALLHFGEYDGYTIILDESKKAWGAAANAQIDTAQYKFTPASGLSDGTGDYIYRDDVGGDSDFAFGTVSWAIDFWIRFASVAGAQILYDSRPTSGTGWYPTIYKDGTTHYMKFFSNGSDRITGTTAMTINTWYHIAVTKDSGTSETRLFVNGTQEGSTYSDSNTYINSSYRPLVFNDGYSVTYCLNGWMDELRVSKGAYRWNANFTPPSSPYGPAVAAAAFRPKVIVM